MLLRLLPEKEQAALRAMKRDDLWMFHVGLGTMIRNEFGLWRGNDPLLAACARAAGRDTIEADEASAVIIERLWEAVSAAAVGRLH